MQHHPTGVLLLQLGTPDSADVSDVRSYLREFLSDPRVLDMPAVARSLLLNAVILPFRPKKSAEAYEKVWTAEGSPLLIHTERLASKVAALLGDQYRVEVGMRYKNPRIVDAIDQLAADGCTRVVVVPLFPQYASASGGSAVAKVFEVVGERYNILDITTVGAFYDDPGYVASVSHVARPHLESFDADHVLFSYHGLPEKQVTKSDPSGAWCLASEGCCDQIAKENRYCYRAQCYATTRSVSDALGLQEGSFSTAFQSRLAGQKWIEPYTDHVLPALHRQGVRRLAVLTPSFVADCLETIEEIGIRGRQQWEQLGGEEFLLVPCINADDSWAKATADMIIRVDDR